MMYASSVASAQKHKDKLVASLAKRVAKGKMTQEAVDALLANVLVEEKSACAGADLIIECVKEDMATKKELLNELDGLCKPEAIFASNTSSLSITEMGNGLKHPVIGMHFFNPVPSMKLVEIIRGSSTCDLIFEDCIVPKENLLGKEGKGFKIAMQTLDGGRIGIAAQALGLGEGAVNEAVKYTQERVQFGKRLSQFQNTQFQLADMHTRMQAAQYLVYAAAMKKQNHEDYSMDASMAKLFAAEAASDVTRRAVQLFGGYGYTREYPVERMMRDAKITEIYEGTSEVQRMVISSRLGVK